MKQVRVKKTTAAGTREMYLSEDVFDRIVKNPDPTVKWERLPMGEIKEIQVFEKSTRKPEIKEVKMKAKKPEKDIPQGSGNPPANDGKVDYRNYTIKELRSAAKNAKIRSAHNMGREKLIAKLSAL